MKYIYALIVILIFGCQRKVDESANSLVSDESESIKRMHTVGLSKLTFPLDFPLTDLSKVINESLPAVLVDDTIQLKKEGDFLKIKIEPTGQMLLASYRNNLDASIPMKVTAFVEKRILGVKVSRPLEFSVRLDINTKLSIGENWNLNSQCRIQKISWIDPPIIEFLGVKVNLQSKIDSKLAEKTDEIEEKVCQAMRRIVPLKEQVENIWTIISSAHRVGKKPIDIWLTSHPSVFTAHFSRNVRDTLRVIIHAESEIYITPLDGLEYQKIPMPNNQDMTLHTEDELDIKVNLYVPYAKMDAVLKDRLDSTSFSYEGVSIMITNFSSGSYQNKLRLSFDVVGNVSASIDAYAYPSLDEGKNLVIDSIDYKIRSDNSLVYLAEWLANESLTDFLQSNSAIPLARILDSLDFKIVKALNKSKIGGKVGLEMNFTELKSDTLIFSKDGFQWFFDVKGNAHAYLTDESSINKSSAYS
jgi:hypothetical protein